MTEATNRSEKALRSLIKSYVADSEQPLAFSWVDSLVRQNDTLVAALVCAEADLEGLVESEQVEDSHPAWQTLKEIRAALEAAK